MRLSILLFVVISCLSCSSVDPAPVQESDEPQQAPNFTLIDFQTNEPVSLSNYRGSPVVINFWFAGCPPCRWEAPSLKRFSEEHPDIVVLSVTEPRNNEDGAIKQFRDEFGWQFPILLDVSGEVTTAFDEDMAYPTTFLINGDSKIVGKIVNYIEWDTIEMRDVVEHLQSGKLLWYYRYLRRLK